MHLIRKTLTNNMNNMFIFENLLKNKYLLTKRRYFREQMNVIMISIDDCVPQFAFDLICCNDKIVAQISNLARGFITKQGYNILFT